MQTLGSGLANQRVYILGSPEMTFLAVELKQRLMPVATVIARIESPSGAYWPMTRTLQELSAADLVVILIGQAHSANSTSRANFFFELGLVLGRMGSERVLLVSFDANRSNALTNFAPFDVMNLPPLLGPSRAGLDQIAERITRILQKRGKLKPTLDVPTYSCFISYSHSDEAFATKLVTDFLAIGATCWFDKHELQAGDFIDEGIKAAIDASDKFIAILSRHSLRSKWFTFELEKALEIERERERELLIPIMLDGAILTDHRPSEYSLADRVMADFREWQQPSVYNKAFRQLSLAITSSIAVGRNKGGK
jgi:hypothetical protein